MDKDKRIQIAFNTSLEIHTQVKILAAIRNISISNWMTRAIKDRIAKETNHDNDNKV